MGGGTGILKRDARRLTRTVIGGLALLVFLAASAHAAATWQFRVLGPVGKPMPETDMTVEYTFDLNGRTLTQKKRAYVTDANGLMSLAVRQDTRYRVLVTCEGVGYALLGPRFSPKHRDTETVTLRLTRTGCVVGRLLGKGTRDAVRYARVHLAMAGDDANRMPPQTLATDAKGYFVAQDLAPGDWLVSVAANGYQNLEEERITVAGGDAVQRLELRLERGLTLPGVVVGEDGKTPVIRADVGLDGGPVRAQTDAVGRFSLPNLRPGTYTVDVRREGYALHRVETTLEKGQEGVPPVRIVLKDRGGTLAGRAENADTWQPLPGETVIAVLEDVLRRKGDPFAAENLVAQRLRDFQNAGWHGLTLEQALTDGNGRYVLEHLAAGRYTVCVIPRDLPGARLRGVAVAEGRRTAGRELRVTTRPKGFFLMRVVDEGSGPLVRTAIRYAYTGKDATGQGTAVTDALGQHYLPMQHEGEFAFAVSAPHRAVARRTVVLKPKGYQEMVFTLPRERGRDRLRGSLTGAVYLPDGKTRAAGVLVYPFSEGSAFPEADTMVGRRRFSAAMSIRTANDGSFRIPGLRPGQYGVYATPFTGLRKDAPPLRPDLAAYAPTSSELIAVQLRLDTRIPDLKLRLAE